jgi:hypothetical protein
MYDYQDFRSSSRGLFLGLNFGSGRDCSNTN